MRYLPLTLLGLAACSEDVVLVDRGEKETYTVLDIIPPADVLFVVDDSGSMAEEQARLSADVGAMVDQLAAATTDVHVGVVTTSVPNGDGGYLVGGLLQDVVAIQAGLPTALLAGTEGERSERGLQAAVLAFDGRNEAFPRPEATLDVIFLTDEDDQGNESPSALVAEWQALAPEGLRVHGVLGDPPEGCYSDDGAADAGTRYLEAIDLTDGYRESICAPSYVGILARLGLDLVGVADTWVLGQVPAVDSIEVQIDGREILEGPVDGWTYEPAPNAIVFHGASIPQPGQEVVIRYNRLAGAGRPL